MVEEEYEDVSEDEIIDKMPRGSDQFVKAILEDGGGPVTFSQIKAKCGKDRSWMNYRFDRLEELGLITKDYTNQGNRRDNVRTATLTNLGLRLAEDGKIGTTFEDEGVDDAETVEDIKDEIEDLQNTVNTLMATGAFKDESGRRVKELQSQVKNIQEDFEEIEDRIKQVKRLDKKIQLLIDALNFYMDEENNVDLADYIKKAQEKED